MFLLEKLKCYTIAGSCLDKDGSDGETVVGVLISGPDGGINREEVLSPGQLHAQRGSSHPSQCADSP